MALGGTCLSDYHCASLFCVEGICNAAIDNGAVCTQPLLAKCAAFGTCLTDPANTTQRLCYYDFTLASGKPMPLDGGDGSMAAIACSTAEYYLDSNAVFRCADVSILLRIDTHKGDFTSAWSSLDCTAIYTKGKRSKRPVFAEISPFTKPYYNESNEDTQMYCPFTGNEKVFDNYLEQYREALLAGDY